MPIWVPIVRKLAPLFDPQNGAIEGAGWSLCAACPAIPTRCCCSLARTSYAPTSTACIPPIAWARSSTKSTAPEPARTGVYGSDLNEADMQAITQGLGLFSPIRCVAPCAWSTSCRTATYRSNSPCQPRRAAAPPRLQPRLPPARPGDFGAYDPTFIARHTPWLHRLIHTYFRAKPPHYGGRLSSVGVGWKMPGAGRLTAITSASEVAVAAWASQRSSVFGSLPQHALLNGLTHLKAASDEHSQDGLRRPPPRSPRSSAFFAFPFPSSTALARPSAMAGWPSARSSAFRVPSAVLARS